MVVNLIFGVNCILDGVKCIFENNVLVQIVVENNISCKSIAPSGPHLDWLLGSKILLFRPNKRF